MKVNGEIIKCMEEVHLLGKMEENILENMTKISKIFFKHQKYVF